MCANILKQKSQQSIIELSSPVVTSDTETNRYRDRNISIKIVGFWGNHHITRDSADNKWENSLMRKFTYFFPWL